MTEKEFDLHYRHLKEQGKAKIEAGHAWLDQEMAKLFDTCDLTQEQIAERVGAIEGKSISRPYLCQRLCFGRFLDFVARGNISGIWLPGLTEKLFRRHYAPISKRHPRGKSGERAVFEEVARALEQGLPAEKKARDAAEEEQEDEIQDGDGELVNRSGRPSPIKDAVCEILGTGWQTSKQLQSAMKKQIAGVKPEQIRNTIHYLKAKPPEGMALEVKQFDTGKEGEDVKRYRLVQQDQCSPVDKLVKLLEPIIVQLEEISQMHAAMMSPVMVGILATRLRRALHSVLKEEKPSSVC